MMLVLFLGIILLIVCGYGAYRVFIAKKDDDGNNSPDVPDTPTPPDTPPTPDTPTPPVDPDVPTPPDPPPPPIVDPGGDPTPGGGLGEKIPPLYSITGRPVPDGVDPLDSMPANHVFPVPSIMAYFENTYAYANNKPHKYIVDITKIPLDGITTGLFSYLAIDDDGSMLFTNQQTDSILMPRFIEHCVKSGVVAGISIGGRAFSSNDDSIKLHKFSKELDKDVPVYKKLTGMETWNKILTDPATREKFSHWLINNLSKAQFRQIGHVNLDFEFPNCPLGVCDTTLYNQKDLFTDFLTELCGYHKYRSFSIVLPSNKYKLSFVDLGKLNKIPNLTFNIMAYDFHVNDASSKNASTGHDQTLLPGHSAYEGMNIKECLEYIASQDNFDGTKYRIGIAVSGRGYLLTTETFNAAVASENFSYLKYEPLSPTTYLFPSSQEPGVVFSSEMDEIEGTKRRVYVPGDGMWLTTTAGPGIFAIPSPRGVFSIRWLASQFGIDNVVVNSPTKDFYANDYLLMPYIKATKMSLP